MDIVVQLPELPETQTLRYLVSGPDRIEMLCQVTSDGVTGYQKRLVVNSYLQFLAGYLIATADRTPQYRQFKFPGLVISAKVPALILNGCLCFVVYARGRARKWDTEIAC